MTDQPPVNSDPKPWIHVNPPVFVGAAVLTFFFVLFAIFAPEAADFHFRAAQAMVTENAGWFYVMAVAGFLVFVIYLAISSHGLVKLGPDHSEPDYSYHSWFAMLFSAGMGIGLMFFGVAEPVMHYVSPPVGEGGTVEAARQAMRITFFHWGVHAWGIYAVVALALAYFSFRHGLPLTIRSALYPLIGNRIYGPIGHAVDIFAVFGTIFGVATSLGFGVIQINSGLNYLFGVPVSVNTQILLIASVTAIATISVWLGLDSGIRRISELNIILAVFLLLFVLVTGPTLFLLQTLVQNFGTYLSGIVASTFNLHAYEPTTWIGGWTLFYWGWWIAWSPFVGMFIARVSRGRTIREFVVGVLFVPVGFTFMWMTFFGDTALHMIMIQGIESLAEAVSEDTSVALFQFFEHLPFSGILSMVATLLVITFFVTSSDSGSLVVDMLTSGGEEDSPVWQRIFWAVTEGIVAAVLLVAGGLGALQAATIASALPFTIIMVFMCWGLLSALRVEAAKRNVLSGGARPYLQTAPGVPDISWRKRILMIVHHPSLAEVQAFLEKTVEPALREVAGELERQNLETSIGQGQDGRRWIEVRHGSETDFFYDVRPKPYEPPAFSMSDTRRVRQKTLQYHRAEVYLREGGLEYDVMGWTKEELIHDVLDQYERHLKFLEVIR